MNKSGQVIVFSFMLAMIVIVLTLGISYAVWEGSNNSYTDMNCTNTTDDFVKAGCYITDLNPFFFLGGLIAIAGIILVARIVYG